MGARVTSYAEVSLGRISTLADFEFREDGMYRNGKRVGTTNELGYRIVFVGKRRYREHRLIWEHHNGPIPDGLVVDHKDGDPGNNRLDNLRVVTRSQNQYNRRAKTDGCGFKGVYKRKTTGRYVASYTDKGEVIYIGTFDTPEEASEAYRAAVESKHGEHSDLNR